MFPISSAAANSRVATVVTSGITFGTASASDSVSAKSVVWRQSFRPIPVRMPVPRTSPTVQALRLIPRTLSFVLLTAPRGTITRSEVFVAAQYHRHRAISTPRRPSASHLNSTHAGRLWQHPGPSASLLRFRRMSSHNAMCEDPS